MSQVPQFQVSGSSSRIGDRATNQSEVCNKGMVQPRSPLPQRTLWAIALRKFLSSVAKQKHQKLQKTPRPGKLNQWHQNLDFTDNHDIRHIRL